MQEWGERSEQKGSEAGGLPEMGSGHGEHCKQTNSKVSLDIQACGGDCCRPRAKLGPRPRSPLQVDHLHNEES